MKCPTLIAAIERDLEAGHAVVVQVVSTGEALLDRRLAAIPASEWSDIAVDITPREYVLDYLLHSFPTQLFEVYSDEEGNQIGRAHVCTPVTNAHLVCRLLLEKKKEMTDGKYTSNTNRKHI